MLQIFLALAVPMAAVSELERLLREKEDVNNNDKNNNEKQEEQQLVPVVEKLSVDPAPIAKPTRKMRRLVILIMKKAHQTLTFSGFSSWFPHAGNGIRQVLYEV